VADDTRPHRGFESGESIERGGRVGERYSLLVLAWLRSAEVLEIMLVIKRWRCGC
jgi:hypothetical protein